MKSGDQLSDQLICLIFAHLSSYQFCTGTLKRATLGFKLAAIFAVGETYQSLLTVTCWLWHGRMKVSLRLVSLSWTLSALAVGFHGAEEEGGCVEVFRVK